MTSRRGVALLIALATLLVVASLGTVALRAMAVRARLVADARWRTEGALVGASELAEARLSESAALVALGEGDTITTVQKLRSDGWQVQVHASRRGVAVLLNAVVLRRDAGGVPIAAHQAALLLVHAAADTVRVSAQHPRF